MKFLLDAGVPRTIQRFLEAEGFNVLHVADIGLKAADDRDIYEYGVC